VTHAVTTNSLSSAETNRTPVDRVDETDCCIVGAGPGGVFLELLLARAGVRVVLLEAHRDFDREYRGEGLQPPTLEILDQLGLLDRFLRLPHSRIPRMVLRTPVGPVTFLDPGKVSARHPYLVYVAQPRLLEFVAAEAERLATFRLVRGARVDRVIQEQGVIRGVNYKQGGTNVVVRASLVVGADGRFSKIRQLSSLELEAHGAAIDMIWLRLPRQPEDTPAQAGIYAGSRGGAYGVAVYRGEQWQIGLAFPKGTYQQLRASGLETVRHIHGEIIPWITDRLGYLQDWAQTAVLSVESSRVRTWHRPRLLLIGDAAHVMSPAGAVGINMAIADAVAAASILAQRLLQGEVRNADLQAVQRRREWHTRLV
jgi:2-polyprenyl-6-methoxyphenol hydroxylase-like FAD-dependent oxidoreductase